MIPHRLLNWLLVALFVIIPSTAYLLDGPSDFDAAIDSQSATQDAIDSVAAAASAERAEARFDQIIAKAEK